MVKETRTVAVEINRLISHYPELCQTRGYQLNHISGVTRVCYLLFPPFFIGLKPWKPPKQAWPTRDQIVNLNWGTQCSCACIAAIILTLRAPGTTPVVAADLLVGVCSGAVVTTVLGSGIITEPRPVPQPHLEGTFSCTRSPFLPLTPNSRNCNLESNKLRRGSEEHNLDCLQWFILFWTQRHLCFKILWRFRMLWLEFFTNAHFNLH